MMSLMTCVRCNLRVGYGVRGFRTLLLCLIAFAHPLRSQTPDRSDGFLLSRTGLGRVINFLTDAVAAKEFVQEKGEEFMKWTGADNETLTAVGRQLYKWGPGGNAATALGCVASDLDASCRERLAKQWDWNEGQGLGDLSSDERASIRRSIEGPFRGVADAIDGAVEDAKALLGFVESAQEKAVATRERLGAQVRGYFSASADFGLEPGSQEAKDYSERYRTSPASVSGDILPLIDGLSESGAIALSPQANVQPPKASGLVAGIVQAYPALQPALASGAAGPVSSFPLASYPEPAGAGVLRLCPGGEVLTYDVRDQQVLDPGKLPSCGRSGASAESLLLNATSGCKDCATIGTTREDSLRRQTTQSGLDGFNRLPSIVVKTPSISESLTELLGKATGNGRAGLVQSGSAQGNQTTADATATQAEKECPGGSQRMQSVTAQMQRQNGVCANARVQERVYSGVLGVLRACRPGGPLVRQGIIDTQKAVDQARTNVANVCN